MTSILRGSNLNKIQKQLLDLIGRKGVSIPSKGIPTTEITNVIIELKPTGHKIREGAIQHLHVVNKEVIPILRNLGSVINADEDTRRAYLYFPELEKGESPCNLIYHFFVRGESLFMNIYLRSLDVLNKFHSDLNTALYCQDFLAKILDFAILKGTITFFIGSVHIYGKDTLTRFFKDAKS